MSTNGSTSTGKVLLLTSATLLFSGAAYLLYNSKAKQEAEASPSSSSRRHDQLIINKFKLIEILDDLKLELTPYYVHYYNLLKMEEDEFARKLGSREKGLRSATLADIRAKVQGRLEKKSGELEVGVLKSH